MTSKMLYGEVDEGKSASLKSVESFRLVKMKMRVKRK